MSTEFCELKTVAERVGFVLSERGIGVREAARLTGVDKAAICRIKNGTAPNPRVKTLLTFCNGLGITLSEFLEGMK